MKLQPEQTLSIFPYRAEFKDDFFELNAEWLEAYFLIEPYDLEVLRNPQEMILDEGGEIYVGRLMVTLWPHLRLPLGKKVSWNSTRWLCARISGERA